MSKKKNKGKKKRVEFNKKRSQNAVAVPEKQAPRNDSPPDAPLSVDIYPGAKSSREEAKELLGEDYPQIIGKEAAESALRVLKEAYESWGNNMALYDRWLLLWRLSQKEDGFHYTAMLEEERRNYNNYSLYGDYERLFQEAKKQGLRFIDFEKATD